MKADPGTAAAEADFAQYLAALLAGDRQQCRATIERWLERGVELRVLYEDLVQRSLYEVGDRWERGEISVATEHLATAITESLLNLVYPRLFRLPHNGRSVVVSCLANEYHQVGGKMVADLFEINGWRSHFLGAGTPQADLLQVVADKRPDVVALSLAVLDGLDTLREAAAAVRREHPAVPIVVGGQAFRGGGSESLAGIAGVRYLATLAELESWLRSFSPHE